MMTNKRLIIRYVHRPIWSFGLIQSVKEWKFTPSDTMTDSDVYYYAQKFADTGAEIDVITEERV